jgi:DNA-binding transcriptional LysR family regulator
VVDASLFTWLEPAMKESLPGVRLVQKRQISQRSVADLRRGELDLAIIGLPSATPELSVESLTVDPLVAAIPEHHSLARRRSISLLELRNDPLFWFSRPLNPAYFDHFEKLFRTMGFDPPRLPEPSDHHVLLGLIADGQGVALIPRSLTSIARSGMLYKALKEKNALTVGIAVAYVPDRLGAPARLLLAKLRDHFGSVPR